MEENKDMNVEVATETVVENKTENKPQEKRFSRDSRPKGNRPPRRNDGKDKKKLLDSTVVSIGRVTKVTKGGRHFRFSAVVVVGNKKGLVGIGTGKANEVPVAVDKAIQAANKNVIRIALIDNRTIPHEAIGKVGSAKVLIKPASVGTGVIAGGAARAVLELAGVKDIVSKSLGSNTKINVAKATLEALKSQRTPERIAALRGKEVGDL